jgi:hypothetical protein
MRGMSSNEKVMIALHIGDVLGSALLEEENQ